MSVSGVVSRVGGWITAAASCVVLVAAAGVSPSLACAGACEPVGAGEREPDVGAKPDRIAVPIAPRKPLFLSPEPQSRPAPTSDSTPDDEPSPITIESPDFRVSLSALLQFRYTASWAPAAPDSDPGVGFQYRRLRPALRASALDGKLKVFVQTEGAGDAELDLLDAWWAYQLTDEWRLRVGRINLQYDRELLTPAPYLLAVDRSALSNTLNADAANRIEGFELRYQQQHQRVYVTVGEGLGVSGTIFNDDRSGWGVTTRYEALLVGDSFADQFQLTAPRGTPRSLQLGVAGHIHHLDGLGERLNATVDLTYKHDGFFAMLAAGAQVGEDRNNAVFNEPEHDWGVTLASGVYVADQLELFARGELGTTSGDVHPDLAILSAGFNYYILGQALKFSTDASVAFNGIGPAFDRSADGFPITPDGAHRYVWRAQIQMLF